MVWPAFWGRMSNGTIQPLPPERVKSLLTRARVELKRAPDGSWPVLDDVMMAKILGLLQAEPRAEGTPIYVAGGKLHKLDVAGKIFSEEDPSAQPYLWPIAHNVRPAAAALGARGCQDCHATDAPIFFGRVAIDSPLEAERSDAWKMSRFQKDLDTAYVADFAWSFRYRPLLKGTVAGTVAILFVLVLAYVMPAFGRLSAATATDRWTRIIVNLAGMVSCGASVASGFPALLSGQALTGYWLMIHVGASGVLAVTALLTAFYWADRNRFGRADWNRARRPFGQAKAHAANPYVVLLRKLTFWIAAVAAVPAAASALLAMFPILASVRQATLFRIHRYAVVPLAAAAALFTILAFVAWLRRYREAPEEGVRTVTRP
jgi:hypothetical protein